MIVELKILRSVLSFLSEEYTLAASFLLSTFRLSALQVTKRDIIKFAIIIPNIPKTIVVDRISETVSERSAKNAPVSINRTPKHISFRQFKYASTGSL